MPKFLNQDEMAEVISKKHRLALRSSPTEQITVRNVLPDGFGGEFYEITRADGVNGIVSVDKLQRFPLVHIAGGQGTASLEPVYHGDTIFASIRDYGDMPLIAREPILASEGYRLESSIVSADTNTAMLRAGPMRDVLPVRRLQNYSVSGLFKRSQYYPDEAEAATTRDMFAVVYRSLPSGTRLTASEVFASLEQARLKEGGSNVVGVFKLERIANEQGLA